MKTLTVLCIMLTGCATIQKHPVATGIAVAVIAGSIAASVHHHHSQPVPNVCNACLMPLPIE